MRTKTGFTLAELLIALAILGVLATFTIPKVLQGQQDSKFKSIAKEMAGTLAAASQQAQMELGKGGDTNMEDIMSFINYVRLDSTSVVDDNQTGGTRDCSIVICYRLHNGAIITVDGVTFGGTASTNAVSLFLDPDGKVTTNGTGRAVMFYLYYSGLVRTRGTILPNTCDENQCWATPNPPEDPPWFSWN